MELSDTSSDGSPAPVHRNSERDSESPTGRIPPSDQGTSRGEYASYRRLIQLSSDEDEDDEPTSGTVAAAKELKKAVRELREAYPLHAAATPAEGEGHEEVEAEESSTLVRGPEEADVALRAVMSLDEVERKQRKKVGKVDWKAVKAASKQNLPYPGKAMERASALNTAEPSSQPRAAKAMTGLRDALCPAQPPVRPAPDIFTHRIQLVRAAHRKAMELDAEVDYLQPYKLYKPKKKRDRSKKKAATSSGSPAETAAGPEAGPKPATKKRKIQTEHAEASEVGAALGSVADTTSPGAEPEPRKKKTKQR